MKEKEVGGKMLGISLLLFVILLMLLFVIASYFISKQQKMGDNVGSELDHTHESIIHLVNKE